MFILSRLGSASLRGGCTCELNGQTGDGELRLRRRRSTQPKLRMIDVQIFQPLYALQTIVDAL